MNKFLIRILYFQLGQLFTSCVVRLESSEVRKDMLIYPATAFGLTLILIIVNEIRWSSNNET